MLFLKIQNIYLQNDQFHKILQARLSSFSFPFLFYLALIFFHHHLSLHTLSHLRPPSNTCNHHAVVCVCEFFLLPNHSTLPPSFSSFLCQSLQSQLETRIKILPVIYEIGGHTYMEKLASPVF